MYPSTARHAWQRRDVIDGLKSTKRDMTFFWVGESRRPACVNFTKARSILVVHLSSPAFNNLVPRLMPINLIPDLSNFIILIVIVDKTFCPLAAACLGHQSIRNAFSTIRNNAVGEFHVFSTLLGRQRTAIKAQVLRLVTARGAEGGVEATKSS